MICDFICALRLFTFVNTLYVRLRGGGMCTVYIIYIYMYIAYVVLDSYIVPETSLYGRLQITKM